MISSLAMYLYMRKFTQLPRVVDDDFAPVTKLVAPNYANPKGTLQHVPPVPRT